MGRYVIRRLLWTGIILVGVSFLIFGLVYAIALIAVMIGIPMGTIAALRSNTLVDRGLMVFSLLTISVPTFFLGLLLIYFFAFRLRLLPIGGYGTLPHLALPALTVALPW